MRRFDGGDFCSVAFSDNQVSTRYPSTHARFVGQFNETSHDIEMFSKMVLLNSRHVSSIKQERVAGRRTDLHIFHVA